MIRILLEFEDGSDVWSISQTVKIFVLGGALRTAAIDIENIFG